MKKDLSQINLKGSKRLDAVSNAIKQSTNEQEQPRKEKTTDFTQNKKTTYTLNFKDIDLYFSLQALAILNNLSIKEYLEKIIADRVALEERNPDTAKKIQEYSAVCKQAYNLKKR